MNNRELEAIAHYVASRVLQESGDGEHSDLAVTIIDIELSNLSISRVEMNKVMEALDDIETYHDTQSKMLGLSELRKPSPAASDENGAT